MKKAVFYVRASTDENKQKHSFEVQTAILKSFASSNGYEVVKIFSEYRSGKTCERQGFLDAIEHVRNTGDYLISYRADRLSRSLDVFSHLKDILDKVRFVEIGDRALEPLMLSVLFGIAANESHVISLRVKAGIAQAKLRNPNRVWGNPNIRTTAVPASLKVRKANARSFNDHILSLINDLTGDVKMSYKEIADKLNHFGLRTRRGSNWVGCNVRRIMLAA